MSDRLLAEKAETLDRRVIASFRQGLPDGAPDIAAMLIDQFLEEAALQGARLREATERGDGAALKAAAHNLKGSSMTMGAYRLGALCSVIEAQAGRAAESSTLITDVMAELDRELVDVRDALTAEQKGTGLA